MRGSARDGSGCELGLGVIEGFFGPPWTMEERSRLASFAQEAGLGFYLYAPKADPFLRKRWRESWSVPYVDGLAALSREFREKGVGFGVGLSPFGLGDSLQKDEAKRLEQQVACLEAVGVDLIGVFFDDMKGHASLAKVQLEAVQAIRGSTRAKILFCPTYYSPDPILEKVFGAMPPGYLEDIGQGLPADIPIAWTGPKVISPEIPPAHLRDVARALGRKPFIWDNLFANDGPRNCKFLRLKPFAGRSPDAFAESGGWALNPMNQSELSSIAVAGAKGVVDQGVAPEESLTSAIERMCSPKLARYLSQHRATFDQVGLDGLDEASKRGLASELDGIREPAALEIARWLRGGYAVGSECLTD